jgi:hypothetical protein
MTDFPTLPQLELGDAKSPFDEAVIIINGHEEETIRIECAGALELADRLIRYVNAQQDVIKALKAAAHALRSYECGNSAPDLAHNIAAHCDAVSKQMGAAA